MTAFVVIRCDICGRDSGELGHMRKSGGVLRLRSTLEIRGWRVMHNLDKCPECREAGKTFRNVKGIRNGQYRDEDYD